MSVPILSSIDLNSDSIKNYLRGCKVIPIVKRINNIKELKQVIETKAYHPYLQKHIEKPVVDEDKLLLLWGLFNELDISNDERNHYILSTMLVQIALDTHEKVSNTNVTLEKSDLLKSRQLTVLAGDFYSGLYYQVLSEVGNIKIDSYFI